MIEIGSEFWQAEHNGEGFPAKQTFLSGRTAMLAIILDMKASGVESVSLPDYCCESMIEPFLRGNMEISFYPVYRENGSLHCAPDAAAGDAVLLMDYFGFMARETQEWIRKCKNNGQCVILDRTHALLTRSAQQTDADYTFGSFRKWTGIEAGIAEKGDGSALPCWEYSDDGKRYIELRSAARGVKEAFVRGGYADEQARKEQLELFSRAEERLDAAYLSDTDEANKLLLAGLDIERIRRRRAENASCIYRYLREAKHCTALFEYLEADTAPLFVPVLIHPEKRSGLRSHLRKNGIFCPVHWPLTDMHRAGKGAKQLFEGELSLICDQRYDEAAMIYMMETIQRWNGN